MFLAPAACSAPFTSLPQQRNFVSPAKPSLSSAPSNLSALVGTPSPSSSSSSLSSLHDGEVSSDVLIAEEQIGRGQARDVLPTSLQLLLSSDVQSMDERVRYVHQCLQAIRAQQAANGAKGFTGPQEELAYAIQQLQSAISAKAPPKQRAQLHYIVEHATREQQLPAALRQPAVFQLHELSAPHRIVSEDVIPHGASTQQLYSSDASNMLGYRKAHEESERLAREGERRRVEYAVRCLQAVEERQRLEEEEQRRAAKQAGPEEQSAYSMISRQARAQALRSKL